MTMLEWLRRIPADLCWTEDAGSHAEVKIGKLAHEAADKIEHLRTMLRQHRCKSDGTMTVAECIDSGRCGCSDKD